MSGDSTITYLNHGKVGLNPFKSRSTVIAFACMGTLLFIATLICGVAWKTGYFNNEVAALIFSNSILILSKIIDSVFGHQAKADQSISNSVTDVKQ